MQALSHAWSAENILKINVEDVFTINFGRLENVPVKKFKISRHDRQDENFEDVLRVTTFEIMKPSLKWSWGQVMGICWRPVLKTPEELTLLSTSRRRVRYASDMR